jgi:hypothetical protein
MELSSDMENMMDAIRKDDLDLFLSMRGEFDSIFDNSKKTKTALDSIGLSYDEIQTKIKE